MIRYWPAPSVVTVRVFSISTGLDASTVTPGSTAPDVSLTTPAIEPWAEARAGTRPAPSATRNRNIQRTIDRLHFLDDHSPLRHGGRVRAGPALIRITPRPRCAS